MTFSMLTEKISPSEIQIHVLSVHQNKLITKLQEEHQLITRDEEEELQQLVPPLQYAVKHDLHNGLNRIIIAKKHNVADWADVRGANIIDALILFFRRTARYFEDIGNRMGKIDTIELCIMSCDGPSRVETYENLDV